MAAKDDSKMGEVLGLLDSLRTEAGNLMADKLDPVFDAERVDVIRDYLEESIISCTKRIGAIKDIIEQTNRIGAQMSEERDALGMKRQTFFRALQQLDTEHAKAVLDKINAVEEAQAEKDWGEYANLPVWEAAKIVLERAGRDMTTKEIVEALRKGGKRLGPKATSAVSAALRTGKAADVFKPFKISGKRLRWSLREPEEPLLPEGEDSST